MTEHSGRCACGAVQFAITDAPLFVNVCHCHHCQRENGTPFACNVLIEAERPSSDQGRWRRSQCRRRAVGGTRSIAVPCVARRCGACTSGCRRSASSPSALSILNLKQACSREHRFYPIEAAMGPHARRAAGFRRLFQHQRPLAGSEHRAPHAGDGQGLNAMDGVTGASRR